MFNVHNIQNVPRTTVTNNSSNGNSCRIKSYTACVSNGKSNHRISIEFMKCVDLNVSDWNSRHKFPVQCGRCYFEWWQLIVRRMNKSSLWKSEHKEWTNYRTIYPVGFVCCVLRADAYLPKLYLIICTVYHFNYEFVRAKTKAIPLNRILYY